MQDWDASGDSAAWARVSQIAPTVVPSVWAADSVVGTPERQGSTTVLRRLTRNIPGPSLGVRSVAKRHHKTPDVCLQNDAGAGRPRAVIFTRVYSSDVNIHTLAQNGGLLFLTGRHK